MLATDTSQILEVCARYRHMSQILEVCAHYKHVTNIRSLCPAYQCCRLLIDTVHSEGSVRSSRHHQSLHCTPCSWHSAASGSSHLAGLAPVINQHTQLVMQTWSCLHGLLRYVVKPAENGCWALREFVHYVVLCSTSGSKCCSLWQKHKYKMYVLTTVCMND